LLLLLNHDSAASQRLPSRPLYATVFLPQSEVLNARPLAGRQARQPVHRAGKKSMMKQRTRILMGILVAAALLGLAACGGEPAEEPPPTATPAPPAPTATPTPVPPTPTPEPAIGSTMVSPVDGMEMVYVPAGEFPMGSREGDSGADSDQFLLYTVYLGGFWIDRTEVTNEQYRRCVEAGTCRALTSCDWGEPTYADPTKADHPVVCVPWENANNYCGWASRRLPTEAEWEKAARGTDGRKYPWGNSFDGSRLNFCDANCEFDHRDSNADDGYERTAPVGSYPRGSSPYGVLDMAGNVWEWVADWFAPDYSGDSPASNPSGPTTGDRRVLRGGGWYYNERLARAAIRNSGYPNFRSYHVGFRCASAVPGQ